MAERSVAVEMQTDDGAWITVTLLPVEDHELALVAQELIAQLDTEDSPWTAVQA